MNVDMKDRAKHIEGKRVCVRGGNTTGNRGVRDGRTNSDRKAIELVH